MVDWQIRLGIIADALDQSQSMLILLVSHFVPFCQWSVDECEPAQRVSLNFGFAYAQAQTNLADSWTGFI